VAELMVRIRRLFAAAPARNRLDIIVWWELRRIPYNLILAFVGAIDFIPMAIEGMLGPLLAVGGILFAVAANVCYTAGWVTELAWTGQNIGEQRDFAPRAFRAGLAFSCLITSVPFWIALFVMIMRRLTTLFPH
jgi:hypothetical protein